MRLSKGQSITVLNTHSIQVCDLWAFNAENLSEYLSWEHTRGFCCNQAYGLAQSGSKMPQELIDETSWVRESNQVAARQLVYGDAQPLLCHAPLKLDWK